MFVFFLPEKIAFLKCAWFSVYLWLTLLLSSSCLSVRYPVLSAGRLLVPAFPQTSLPEPSPAVARGVVRMALSVLVAQVAWLRDSGVGSPFMFPGPCSFRFTPLFWRECSWEFSFCRLWQFACIWTSRLDVLPQGLKSMAHSTAFLFPVLLL